MSNAAQRKRASNRAQAEAADLDRASRPTANARTETLYVFDTTAAPGAVRVHEVIVARDSRGRIATKSYSLTNDKGTEMPAAHALQFLRDDAFIVASSADFDSREQNRVRPVKARQEQIKIISLTEDETIAEWSELSEDALVRRALAFPSEEKPDVNASRAELIVFLTKASRVKKTEGDRLPDDAELEGMAGAELDALFGGDRQKGLNNNPMETGKKPN